MSLVAKPPQFFFRSSREADAEIGISKRSRKKVTKENISSSAKAGFQLHRDQ